MDAQTIPFRGGAEAATALLGGNTDFSGQVYAEVLPHVKAGRVKVLAVGTRERDPVIPDVPTFLEQGVNVWTFGAIRGIGAPKGTPEPIIDYLESAVRKFEKMKFNPLDCRNQAKKFSKERFKKEMLQFVNSHAGTT